MTTPDPPRAYVSGDAGLAFVVADGETYLLEPDSRPTVCSSAWLANLLALSRDIDAYAVPADSPFSDVIVDVERRTRASRCVDYIVAVFDPELPSSLRARAARAAQRLLDETPDLLHEMQRVFFNVALPQNADPRRAASLSRDQSHVHELVTRIGFARDQITSLHARWEQESSRLPSAAMRSEAAALIRRRALVAELLMGTYDESLVRSADPVIRQAIARWVAAVPVRPDRKLVQRAAVQHPDVPSFGPGDTVKVHVKVKEGDKERIQVFQGVVISRRGAGSGQMFTVRKVAGGVAVERAFRLGSPTIEKIEVERHGRIRRAKLHYLRELRGEPARTERKRAKEKHTGETRGD